ncbi:Hypothetical protein FKW44_006008 [Caligus rogercresseyi]|uniref:Uncharacterized protein n=1 Tax=Caligus rogercresseyi TaxID=217165 RepID=A0A7T8KCT2_CALRO|nr:Hypothetical protein FKW44_006008 [Caligus rogercresseyi]
MEKGKRETVVELVRAGHGAKAIKDITGYASAQFMTSSRPSRHMGTSPEAPL